MGPTASGKTAVALQLAEQLPCEIISVDSALVYRGLDVGAAKPSLAVREKIPHHLIDIRDPADPYSAADFREDALRAIDAILVRGRIPLLVGGTMLYFRALLKGLSDLPSADPEVREHLSEEAAQLGWQAMHARLAEIDPLAAQRIHPNDPQRIQRALEVHAISGKSMSEWQAQSQGEPLVYQTINLAVAPAERAVLHTHIAQRFEEMLAQGVVKEVERLRAQKELNLNSPSMRAVGYRQIWQYLEGEYDESEMRARVLAATRQLAKRQLTWLRHFNDLHWFDSTQSDLFAAILRILVPITENNNNVKTKRGISTRSFS